MKTSGLDVHKDNIFCDIYDGKSHSPVKEFLTTSNSIRMLGEYLRSEKVKKVAMESTSTYWILIWNILLEMDFELKLVNALQIKQMPGRKSDTKDAQWIAELLHKNMLRSSLVPCPLYRSYEPTHENIEVWFNNGQKFRLKWTELWLCVQYV